MPSLIKIGPVVLEKKMKKVYDNDNDNDDDVQGTNFDQKSSLEPTGSGELKTLAKIPEE